ncbi:mCG1039549 [Mus musculus]|nr:mCG1039549 [Mus musculus]
MSSTFQGFISQILMELTEEFSASIISGGGKQISQLQKHTGISISEIIISISTGNCSKSFWTNCLSSGFHGSDIRRSLNYKFW